MTELSFDVSVVIPVYNAEKFLQQAVESAIMQDDVKEVLLIEDGSVDHSLELCVQLEQKYEKVKLLTHNDNANLGPGETRNKGVNEALCNYIAFLDADDHYLPQRFLHTKSVFAGNILVDGVYEVVGASYDSEEMKAKHLLRMSANKKNIVNPQIPLENTGMESKVNPKDLFYSLLKSDQGWIHLNGLTIKSSALQDIALFNSNFLGQDSEFITRLSAEKVLSGTGNYAPVAIRMVHVDNRILNIKKAKKNRTSIDNQYWLKYCIAKRKYGKELIYLLLRISDSENKIKKLFLLTKNALRTVMMIMSIIRTEKV